MTMWMKLGSDVIFYLHSTINTNRTAKWSKTPWSKTICRKKGCKSPKRKTTGGCRRAAGVVNLAANHMRNASVQTMKTSLLVLLTFSRSSTPTLLSASYRHHHHHHHQQQQRQQHLASCEAASTVRNRRRVISAGGSFPLIECTDEPSAIPAWQAEALTAAACIAMDDGMREVARGAAELYNAKRNSDWASSSVTDAITRLHNWSLDSNNEVRCHSAVVVHHHHHHPRISSRRKSWNKTSGPLHVLHCSCNVKLKLMWPAN